MVTKKELLRKMAELESINDQLTTELTYVDHLMREVGFANGLNSIKETAQEMIHEGGDAIIYPDPYWGDEGLESI